MLFGYVSNAGFYNEYAPAEARRWIGRHSKNPSQADRQRSSSEFDPVERNAPAMPLRPLDAASRLAAVRLDHVVLGVRDLDDAAVRLRQEHGLRFLRGGRHPGGTVNSVAPLAPPQYLELLAVVDVGGALARRVQALIEAGRCLLGWAIGVDDIELIAAQLGRRVEAGSITRADGSISSWRFVSDPSDESLPFFIAYGGDPAARLQWWQGRVRQAGSEDFGGFTFVEVGGDHERIRSLLADADLPVRFASGRPGLHAVGVSGPTREIVLRETE